MLTRRAMLTSTPALALAVATPAAAQCIAIAATPFDHVERLAQELAAAFAKCDDGLSMVRVYPSGSFEQGDFFHSYMPRGRKEHRLRMALAELKRSVAAHDPAVIDWQEIWSQGNKGNCRFVLSGWKNAGQS